MPRSASSLQKLRDGRLGGGSCATVEAKKYTPVKPTGDQVTATGTHATDSLTVGDTQGTITLVTQGGTWLVDGDTTLK